MAIHNLPLVSIVILNFNGERYVEACLSSVLRTDYPNFEVIFVDNASLDYSLKIAKTLFATEPRLRIVESMENLGFSGGNNVGFNHSNGDYIVFLNNDTAVDPGWLTPLVDAMERDPTIGLAQSVILTIDGKKIQTAGWLFSNYLIHKHALYVDRPGDIALEPIFESSFISGASMMIRREIAEKMGLFEPKIPFFYDDVLLTLKTRLAKKRVVTVSDSRIRHVGGATNVWKMKFTTYHLQRANMILLFDIYYSRADLVRGLLVYALHSGVNSVFLVYQKNTAALFGMMDALGWSFKNFRFLWQNRLNHWHKSTVSPRVLKADFVRVKVPTAFDLLPSRRGNDCFRVAVDAFERAVLKK